MPRLSVDRTTDEVGILVTVDVGEYTYYFRRRDDGAVYLASTRDWNGSRSKRIPRPSQEVVTRARLKFEETDIGPDLFGHTPDRPTIKLDSDEGVEYPSANSVVVYSGGRRYSLRRTDLASRTDVPDHVKAIAFSVMNNARDASLRRELVAKSQTTLPFNQAGD
ncbi:MAG: hypothetical protein ABIB97_05565 [Patescibacteria group bacterium]